jgi:hypothetical protein
MDMLARAATRSALYYLALLSPLSGRMSYCTSVVIHNK